MKLSETNYRSLFQATLFLKGLIALGEVVAGFLFAFASYATLRGWAYAFTGDELMERPSDLFWHYLLAAFHGITATPREVWAFIFLSHGIVKLALIAGLLKGKLWTYPWSAVIFTGFIAYQIWQMLATFSLALLLITILDAVVVALILHEYRWQRRRQGRTERAGAA